MAGSAQDVEAGRAFVTLYLRRANYDQQVDELERDEDTGRPVKAASRENGNGSEDRGQLHRISKLIGYRGDLGNIAGLLRLLRDSARDASSSMDTISLAAATGVPKFTSLQTAIQGTTSSLNRTIPVFGHTNTVLGSVRPSLKVAGAGFQIFKKAVLGIPQAITSTIGVMRKMPSVFSKTGDAAEKSAGKTTKAFAQMSGKGGSRKPAASRRGGGAGGKVALATAAGGAVGGPVGAAVGLAASATVAAAKKTVGALSSIVRSMRRLAIGAVRMAGRFVSAVGKMAIRVVAQVGKIAKALAQIPGKLVKATSAAMQRAGASLAKFGAITGGITAAIVGSATLAAKSWAAYGQRIRGVQNDLMRFQLTAEEASIIARVSDQTGESMVRLARDMRDGTRDFSRWRNELKQSGILMSGAGLSAALALGRAYSSLKGSVMGLKGAIGAALGPTLTEGAELFTGMVRGVTRWVSKNKPLVVQVFKIAAAVGIAAGLITTLGGAIAGVGTIITPFAASLAAIAGVLALIEIRTEAGRSFWGAYGDSVRRVYGTVSKYLGQMLDFTDKVIGGIKDALIAGDLAAAVDVMWGAAKVAWIEALLEIDKLTSGTFGGILQSLAAGKWASAAEGAMNALKIAWLEGVGFLTGVWDQVVIAAETAWDRILVAFDSMITSMKNGMAGFLNWVRMDVLQPILEKLREYDNPIASGTFAAIGQVSAALGDAQIAILTELKDEENEEAKEEPKLDHQPGSRLERRALANIAQLAREEKITALKERQAELAGQAGEEAKQQQTKNQKALDAALAAAKAARDAVDANKLRDEDFAVSQESQSIVRFSGEALGLSVGRRDDPAEKTVKLTAEQNEILKDIRKKNDVHNREMLRLIALGGFG